MKLLKHNHLVKIILGVVVFLFLFYFLNKMFERTSSLTEGFCPPNQYLNQDFDKCCVVQNWYSPIKNTCISQQQGNCKSGQYMNDKFNECCDKDKYYHSKLKKCVNMK